MLGQHSDDTVSEDRVVEAQRLGDGAGILELDEGEASGATVHPVPGSVDIRDGSAAMEMRPKLLVSKLKKNLIIFSLSNVKQNF